MRNSCPYCLVHLKHATFHWWHNAENIIVKESTLTRKIQWHDCFWVLATSCCWSPGAPIGLETSKNRASLQVLIWLHSNEYWTPFWKNVWQITLDGIAFSVQSAITSALFIYVPEWSSTVFDCEIVSAFHHCLYKIGVSDRLPAIATKSTSVFQKNTSKSSSTLSVSICLNIIVCAIEPENRLLVLLVWC